MLKKAPHTLKLSQDFFQNCNILIGIRYQKCNAFCLQLIQPNGETHVKITPSKGIQDWIPDSLSVELGFRILSRKDSSRIPVVRIPWATCGIPKPRTHSVFHKKNFLHSGIRIPLHWAIGKTIPCLSSQSKGLKTTFFWFPTLGVCNINTFFFEKGFLARLSRLHLMDTWYVAAWLPTRHVCFPVMMAMKCKALKDEPAWILQNGTVMKHFAKVSKDVV